MEIKDISIFEASLAEKEILENFLTLYLHDLSEFTDRLDINHQGFFEYRALDQYYYRPFLIPLLYKVNYRYTGFILLDQRPNAPRDVDYFINEFFLLKKYRRKGIAKMVIKELFHLYPGRYLVLQLMTNVPAINFWHRVYEENEIQYVEKIEELDGEKCLSQEFLFSPAKKTKISNVSQPH